MSPLKDFSRHKSSAGAKSYQYKSAVENFSGEGGGGVILGYQPRRDVSRYTVLYNLTVRWHHCATDGARPCRHLYT